MQKAEAARETENKAGDNNEQIFRSDIAGDALPNRTAEYHIVITREAIDHDPSRTEYANWIINNVNISSQQAVRGCIIWQSSVKSGRTSDYCKYYSFKNDIN